MSLGRNEERERVRRGGEEERRRGGEEEREEETLGKSEEGLTIVERGEAKKHMVKKLQMIPSWVNTVDTSLTRNV